MASDPARAYVEAVNVELDLITESSNEFTFGKLKKDEHNRPPIINWQLGTITHGPAEQANSIGTETQELLLRIWASGIDPDDADWNTRDLKNKVLRACKTVALRGLIPDPVEFGEFGWNEEAHVKLGRALEGSVEVKLNMPAEDPNTVVILSVAKTTHLVDPRDETGATTESLGTIIKPAP